MADDDDDNSSWTWSMTDQPFSYVIFPLLILFIAGFVAVILFRRRRRRMAGLHGQWPHDRTTAHIGHPPPQSRGYYNFNTRRWAPWGPTQSSDGLNELGEAPPPYDGKRDGNVQESELRDLESGTANPPTYPAEPGPAVTRDQQRWA